MRCERASLKRSLPDTINPATTTGMIRPSIHAGLAAPFGSRSMKSRDASSANAGNAGNAYDSRMLRAIVNSSSGASIQHIR